MSQIAAFFDLDRTLIDVNSAILYAMYERKHGRISNRMFVEAAFTSLLYHFNLLDMESAYSKATRHYEGALESEINQQTKEFFHSCVAHRIQSRALEVLQDHKASGHISVLLSTTSSFQGKEACKTWGIEHSLTNEFPVTQGRLTGALGKPFCYHEGKVKKAEVWAEEHGVNIDQSYFYSDSFSDLPMLERVGHPKVVNPDPKLRRWARKKGWEIFDWKRDEKLSVNS